MTKMTSPNEFSIIYTNILLLIDVLLWLESDVELTEGGAVGAIEECDEVHDE